MENKKVAFVVYSDIHLNIWNNFNENDRRIKDGMEVQNQIKLIAQKHKAPTLFIGDLLHNEKFASNKLLSYILPHFRELWGYSGQNPTYAISGNHDQSEQNTPEHKSPSYIETFSKIFNDLHCMDFESWNINGIMVHGIPYLTHDMGLYKSLKKIKKSKTYKNILMLHTTLTGAKDTDGREIENNSINKKIMKLIKSFDLVVCGHIHLPMKLANNIIQVGATNQQRKTDKDSDLGYWLVYKDLSVKFKKLKFPKFVELPYGEEKPDEDNFYYNKEKVEARISREGITNDKFTDVNNKTKLAKSYIREKSIKDKDKKEALISILKNSEE